MDKVVSILPTSPEWILEMGHIRNHPLARNRDDSPVTRSMVDAASKLVGYSPKMHWALARKASGTHVCRIGRDSFVH